MLVNMVKFIPWFKAMAVHNNNSKDLYNESDSPMDKK